MKWKTVYNTENVLRAEMVKSILEEKGFNPVLINKKDSSYLFGLMEIQVSVEEVLESLRIIEKIKFE